MTRSPPAGFVQDSARRYHRSSSGRTCRRTPDNGASGENGTRMRLSQAAGGGASRHAPPASATAAIA